MNNSAPKDWVLAWQRKLYRWSKQDQNKTYSDLFNLVYDPRTLRVAWDHIRVNRGSKSAGVDGMTRYHVEQGMGIEKFLHDLHKEIKTRTYRPQPVRQKGIPKTNGKTRYLGIPTLRDRVVQQALRMVLEPIFEAGFYTSSYGYRPNRRAQDAIGEIYRFAVPRSKYEWIIEGDIKSCFDNIDHPRLLEEIRKRITDRKILRLVMFILKAGVMTEMGTYQKTMTGTPQGGIISPLLMNVYLTVLDRHFEKRWQEMSQHPRNRRNLQSKGFPTYRMVRFADDFVVMVRGTEEQAESLKNETALILQRELRMELSLEKTHVTHVRKGFNFLGHKIVMFNRQNKDVLFTLPSKSSLQTVKSRIKQITSRRTIRFSLEQLLFQLNPILRGWSYYFRWDAAKSTLSYLDYYVWRRVFGWMKKKHPKHGIKALKRKYFPDWQFKEGKQILFRPSKVKVERYRYRGARIPSQWEENSNQKVWNQLEWLEILENLCNREN